MAIQSARSATFKTRAGAEKRARFENAHPPRNRPGLRWRVVPHPAGFALAPHNIASGLIEVATATINPIRGGFDAH